MHTAVHVADLNGQRWLVGLEGHGKDERAVLLYLDASGRVITTALPAWTERVAVQPPYTLRFLVTAPEPKWWTVDVSNPDAPVVAEPKPVVDLSPGRFPKAFAADATRAVIALYEENPSDAGPRYVGRTALFEVPSGKRLSPDFPTTAWAAECMSGRCFAVASPNPTEVTQLVELTAAEQRVVTTFASVGAPFRQGSTWFLIDCGPATTSFFALALGDGSLRRGVLDVPAESCHSLGPLRLGDRAGLAWRTRDGLEAVLIDESLRAQQLPLGRVVHGQRRVAPVSDGLVVADFESRHGMVHSPQDRKIRRYFRVWEFAGRAGFIPKNGRGFRELSDVVTLPHDGEEGKFTSGYQAELLTRGAHASVLVLGDSSVALRLREPCRH